MSDFERRSIDAFGQIEIIEAHLKEKGDVWAYGTLFAARMEIHAYIMELKMKMKFPELKIEVKS